MIGTELLKGMGLGNQLLVYVSTRCMAIDNGLDYALLGKERMAVNIHNDKGMYFMDMGDIDSIPDEKKQALRVLDEREERLYIGNSPHDIENGVYVAGADERLLGKIEDNSLIMGNLQAEEYFISHIPKLKEWLKVRPEYESEEFSKDDICVINIRGGEYTSNPELFLNRGYYLNAMKYMKSLKPDMRFVIITDDVEAAGKILPGVEAHHFDIAKDYVTIKNAYYLILSNSSFAILPSHVSECLRLAIAPKYWARYNVSDGYWASEQNIYSLYKYMDKKGKLFTAKECREELLEYKKKSRHFKKDKEKAKGIKRFFQYQRSRCIYTDYWIMRIVNSFARRMRIKR